MSETKSMEHNKRPLNDEEEETSSKKRSDEAVNGLDLQRSKDAPRLSPALFCDNCEIGHLQLHQLLKYAVIGNKGRAAQASWCSILHQELLRGVVVVVLQDLAQLHYNQFNLHFHSLQRFFGHRFSLPPPPSDFTASLLGLNDLDFPAHKEKINDELSTKAPGTSTPHDPTLQHEAKRHGLTTCLLTKEEMRDHDYPFVGSSDTKDYVHTGCTEEPTDDSPLFGLDCEMCVTCKGYELTRVSLVNAQGYCILLELVKPDNRILDYKTRFSGITRNMLFRVQTKLKDVQERLKRLLPPNAVLVGHSLSSDLQALQMIHPHVIDTALLFAQNSQRKFKLKLLAERILSRKIQREDAVGHNPSEDAVAALNLAQYFIQHGPEKSYAPLGLTGCCLKNVQNLLRYKLVTAAGYSRNHQSNNSEMESRLETNRDMVADIKLRDIFLRTNSLNSAPGISKASEIKQNVGLHPLSSRSPSFLEELEKTGQKIAYVSRDGLKDHVPSAQFEILLCASNEEVLEKACSVIPRSPISIVQFHQGSIYNKCHVDTDEKGDRTEIIKDLDRKIDQLYKSILENTLCVILFPGNNSSGSLPGFGLMGIKC